MPQVQPGRQPPTSSETGTREHCLQPASRGRKGVNEPQPWTRSSLAPDPLMFWERSRSILAKLRFSPSLSSAFVASAGLCTGPGVGHWAKLFPTPPVLACMLLPIAGNCCSFSKDHPPQQRSKKCLGIYSSSLCTPCPTPLVND